MRRLGRLVGALAIASALASCKPPKHVKFTSYHGDFACEVPWGWAVIQDRVAKDYTNVTFTGPFEPMFYRGLPSFSLRWYRTNTPHRLPDGAYETYKDHEDFTRQMLTEVYAPEGKMWGGADAELREALSRQEVLPTFQRIRVSGWEAYYFVMFNEAAPAKNAVYGVVGDGTKRVIEERHAYVLLPMDGGFYVLIYPATRDGFPKYKSAFFRVVKSFRVLTKGPGGPKVEVSAGQPAAPGEAPALQ
ncbi:MAG: hypothetical protein HY059_18865 [Proteobacteria bacterium]|nr:hypothetical protein [Pseudomonadota bacterium]